MRPLHFATLEELRTVLVLARLGPVPIVVSTEATLFYPSNVRAVQVEQHFVLFVIILLDYSLINLNGKQFVD